MCNAIIFRFLYINYYYYYLISVVSVCNNSARGQALRPFLQVDLMQLLPIIGTEVAGFLSFAYYICLLFHKHLNIHLTYVYFAVHLMKLQES